MTYRISCVCLGNICRSPIAETILSERFEQEGRDDVLVDSAGTSHWHVGADMDPRSRQLLAAHGHDKPHKARQITDVEIDCYDLILAMDSDNLADLTEMAAKAGVDTDHIRLFRSFDPTADEGAEVPDPYYGGDGGFEEVLRMVERAADGVVVHVLAELD